jgi:hypothetical protein
MYHMMNGNLPFGMNIVCVLMLIGLVLGNIALIKYIFLTRNND